MSLPSANGFGLFLEELEELYSVANCLNTFMDSLIFVRKLWFVGSDSIKRATFSAFG